MEAISKFLNHYGTIIAWIPTIIFAIFIIFNVVKGMLRGFRKNLILTTISLCSFLTAYILYLCILRKPFFESSVLVWFKKANGKTLNETLGVSEEYSRIKTIVAAAIEGKITSTGGKEVYLTFSPYVEAIAEAIIGVIYLIVTLIMWALIYVFIGRTIYLIFFSESAYRRKLKKEKESYDAAVEDKKSEMQIDAISQAIQAEQSRDVEEIKFDEEGNPIVEEAEPSPQINTESAEEQVDVKKPKIYSRRRLLGGLIGFVKGIVLGALAVSAFGTIFYISTGMKTNVCKSSETVTVSYNGNEYDLTDIYKFVYEYDRTGVNYVLDHTKIGGTPVYVSVSNLFCNGKIVVKEDGINTKIYPIEELADLMEIVHSGIALLNKYDISLDKDGLFDTLVRLIDNDPNFVDDAYSYIKSFGRSRLHRALGKTVTKHFADMVTSLGYSNKYFDVLFKGEHAINIDDILTKADIKQFIKIASKALSVYSEYDADKDYKRLIVESCNNVKSLTDEVLKLSVFSAKNKSNLNACVSELLEVALENNAKFSQISFDGIVWFGNSGSGEIANFINALTKFLNSDVLTYESNNIMFNFSHIHSIFEAEEGETSVMDDIRKSTALRRVASVVLETTTVDDNELYIPDACLDSDGYVSKNEFDGLFRAVDGIISAMNFEGKDNVALSSIVSTVVPEIISSIQKEGGMADIVVESKLLTSIASKFIYDSIKSTYTVPDMLVLESDTLDTNMNNWIGRSGELFAFLKAICLVGSVDDLKMTTALDLDDAKIEALCASKVVSSIITKTIKDVNITDLPLVILDECYDEYGFIKSSEVKGMLHAIKAISGYDSMTEADRDAFTPDSMTIDPKEVLGNPVIRASIFESLIIEATISYRIVSMESGQLSVPDELKMENTQSSNIYNWIGDSGELRYFVDGVNALGIVDQLNGDSTNFNINSVLESGNMSIALMSKILWYTFSDKIVEESVTNTQLVIPSVAYDSNDKISKAEILATVNAINELQKNQSPKDISSFDSNTILKEDMDMNLLLESYIIWFSVSKSFISTTGVVVPTSSYVDKSAEEKYIKKIEIINTIKSLKVFGESDLENVVLDSAKLLALHGQPDKVEIVLDSYISYYEISKTFSEKITSLPENTKTVIDGDNYIVKSELVTLIDVLDLLDITTISSYEVKPSIVIGLTKEEQLTLLSSYVIWHELSLQIITSDTFVIPTDVIDQAISGVTYLIKSELLYILEILNGLEITDFNTANTNPQLITEKGLTQSFARSYIMRATMARTIFYNNYVALVDVKYAYDILQDYETNKEILVYTAAEAEYIIDGLSALGVTGYQSGISFDIEKYYSLSNSKKEIVLASYTLWLYTSNLVKLYTPDTYWVEQKIIYFEGDLYSEYRTVVIKERLLQ